MSKKYGILLGVFIILYELLVLVIPPDQAILDRYGLNAMQLQFIESTLILLLAIIWYAAFYGFSKFKEYALKIMHSPDGRAFNTLASGIGVLAFSLPITTIASTGLSYFARAYPDFTPATVVTNRYIALVLAGIAMVLIYRGSKGLAALTTKKFRGSRYVWIGTTIVLIMGGLYAYIALTNTASSVPDPATGRAVFYLPAWLIITTNIIPYICIWLLGLKSIAFILFFKRNAEGLVYGRALSRVAAGLGLVVSTSIAVQLLTALGGAQPNWGLRLLLAITYLLVGAMAIGYILIAVGAKKLKMIEEV